MQLTSGSFVVPCWPLQRPGNDRNVLSNSENVGKKRHYTRARLCRVRSETAFALRTHNSYGAQFPLLTRFLSTLFHVINSLQFMSSMCTHVEIYL